MSVSEQRVIDEMKGLVFQGSQEWADRMLAFMKFDAVKFISGDMLLWGHIIKLRIWEIFSTPCCACFLCN